MRSSDRGRPSLPSFRRLRSRDRCQSAHVAADHLVSRHHPPVRGTACGRDTACVLRSHRGRQRRGPISVRPAHRHPPADEGGGAALPGGASEAPARRCGINRKVEKGERMVEKNGWFRDDRDRPEPEKSDRSGPKTRQKLRNLTKMQADSLKLWEVFQSLSI